jgi:hypothetical protein
MADEQPPGVLGGLPRTRPHRRSDKRAQRPAAPPTPAAPAKAGATKSTAVKPRAVKPHAVNPRTVKPRTAAAEPRARVTKVRTGTDAERPRKAPPPPARTAGPLGTAVQAAAELTEIGLMASARALRGALSRLPHP